ncbi:MAG TPA: glycosyltransferase family 2 protein [Verrucomicrobiae bacterium]|nr:glycosyltransferase family 2 protein [Verrucomicrobiae bacterium]
MKKVLKTTAHHAILTSKKIIGKSPMLKSKLKKALLPHLGVVSVADKNYDKWLENNLPDGVEVAKIKRAADALPYRPLISVIVPTYNTNHQFLSDCFESVLAQAYDNWELCVVDDASPDEGVRDIIKEYAQLDSRIKYKLLEKNQHIAGATNEAIAMASGEFVSLFDHDDILWPNALYEVAKALNKDKTLDFLYTDEDKITENRKAYQAPFFKPDWNPDFLHSVNYITHFSTIRKTILDQLGGQKKDYNGAQDWDLFLRVTGVTKKIHHIPRIVYSWRIHDSSTAKSTDTKPYVIEAQKKAIEDDLKRKGHPEAQVKRDPKNPGYWMVEYPVENNPLISIVIPTKNQYKVVKRCITSIYAKTTYQNFEIILVDTGSTDKRVLSWYEQLKAQHRNLKIVDWPEQPFSYARSCNEGARHARGELLVMLNNDTEVITPNWLELLAGDAQRKEIGAVGCLLFFPDKVHVQHAGIGVGLGGVAANSFSMAINHGLTPNQHLYLNTKHNMTAVTAACMMIKKSLYDEIGGFDEEFRVTYNDVDLCLRLREKGYYNLYTPYVQLLHHESISVGLPSEIKKRDTKEMRAAMSMFKERWAKYIQHDPDLNPNINKDNALYEVDPRHSYQP